MNATEPALIEQAYESRSKIKERLLIFYADY